MGKSLSDDLRVCVVEAVEAGASRRRAAARFGVSVSSAIRWVRAWHAQGDVRAKPQGGDRRSVRIEAHGGFLLDQIEQTPDVTLAGRTPGADIDSPFRPGEVAGGGGVGPFGGRLHLVPLRKSATRCWSVRILYTCPCGSGISVARRAQPIEIWDLARNLHGNFVR